jgi:DNA-3-methyladenine glycosylase
LRPLRQLEKANAVNDGRSDPCPGLYMEADTMRPSVESPEFYRQPALKVARALLGQRLVHAGTWGRRVGRIVEAEAYVGEHDLACHASKGRTPRTQVLFGPPGRAYVYFIYGMYHCFNVVTCPEGEAAAVLVRGLEPLEGFASSARLDGPGKLCRAMGIDLSHNRTNLLEPGGALFLEPGAPVPPRQVARGPRIGVDYAGVWAAKPYRFWVVGSAGVSRSRSVSRRTTR